MRKILSSILCLSMILSMSMTAFATNITEDGASQNMTITYGASESFLVNIPSSIEMDAGYGESEISASNVMIQEGHTLNITISSDDYVDNWELIDETNPSNKLIYRIYSLDNGVEFVNNSVVLSVASGESHNSSAYAHFSAFLDEVVTKSGRYTDTLTFTVKVESSAKLIQFTAFSEKYQTSYDLTAEEGMTWIDWVGSKYNTIGVVIRDNKAEYPYGYPLVEGSSGLELNANTIIEASNDYYFLSTGIY